jgi:predicted dehydrogenase
MTYRVNAGMLPRGHWLDDLARGGGRLKGEGCHFIDFLCDQAASDPISVTARGFRSRPDLPLAATDNFSVEIGFEDESVGTLHYAADAPLGPGKERFEMSAPGVYAEIDDYRRGRVWRGRQRERLGGARQDKGFAAQFDRIAKVMRGEVDGPATDGFWITTMVTLAAARSLETGAPELVVEPRPTTLLSRGTGEDRGGRGNGPRPLVG